jgi:hypothetical protein
MDEEEVFIDLLAKGALKFMGYDPNTDEKMYVFTPKIKEIMPDLYEEHLNSVNREVMNLWEKGYIDLDLMAKDPLISITKKALSDIDIMQLSETEQWSLNEIKRVLLNRNI